MCSGIEAASVAWRPLGWSPVAFSEIEPFPCAVLAHHYPDVPNWGDLLRYREWPDASFDVLVGGTPCQSFSVAGLRKGLADPRGNLMLTYLGVADRYRPRWVVWENVPGVLSSNKGRDFGTFLGALGEIGYGFAYRILDAQFCGVPQRRRRVFVVGCLGDWRRAAAVLFERHSLSGHPPPRRKAGEGSTYPVAPCIGASGRGFERTGDTRGRDCLIPERARALTSSNQRIDAETETLLTVVGTLAGTLAGSGAGMDRASGQHNELDFLVADMVGMKVRRLTPRECERLQGFPDDYTLIPLSKRNKKGERKELLEFAMRTHQDPALFKWSADGPRYKALGNSMAVPCIKWFGERIAAVHSIP